MHMWVCACMGLWSEVHCHKGFLFTLLCLHSVYISTFNYYVRLQFQEGVGGQGLFVLYLYECFLVVYVCESLTCMHCQPGAVSTRFCVDFFMHHT